MKSQLFFSDVSGTTKVEIENAIQVTSYEKIAVLVHLPYYVIGEGSKTVILQLSPEAALQLIARLANTVAHLHFPPPPTL